jgi:hypothetical protein
MNRIAQQPRADPRVTAHYQVPDGCFVQAAARVRLEHDWRIRPYSWAAAESHGWTTTRIRNSAGTGKTATLQELRRGLVEAGCRVVALAPTMSAVAELQAVGDHQHRTYPGALCRARLFPRRR